MRKSNLTYKQLIELAPKDKPFQIEVESNAKNEGGKQMLWGNIFKGQLDTCLLEQDDMNNIRYDYFDYQWRDKYKGTFTLIDEYRNMYEKPEVLEIGTEVEILESARNCGEYDDWSESNKEMIGKIFKIDFVQDDSTNIYYEFYTDIPYKGASHCFPHYCVRPIEKVEEKEEEIITVNGKKYKLIEE